MNITISIPFRNSAAIMYIVSLINSRNNKTIFIRKCKHLNEILYVDLFTKRYKMDNGQWPMVINP